VVDTLLGVPNPFSHGPLHFITRPMSLGRATLVEEDMPTASREKKKGGIKKVHLYSDWVQTEMNEQPKLNILVDINIKFEFEYTHTPLMLNSTLTMITTNNQ